MSLKDFMIAVAAVWLLVKVTRYVSSQRLSFWTARGAYRILLVAWVFYAFWLVLDPAIRTIRSAVNLAIISQ